MIEENRVDFRIGVLVPFTNTNLECDCMLLQPERIGFHFARLGGYEIDAIPDANQMSGLGHSDIREPLNLIAGIRPDVVLYGCTSATLSIGPEFDRNLADRIEKLTGATTVTAAGALVHALQTLSAKRIAFASPYVSILNNEAIRFLSEFGYETVSRADYPETLDNFGQGKLSPERVLQLAMEADSKDAEVIVLSCTDMRALEIADRLERQCGKPVLTSNQAMVFQALQLLGIEHYRDGYGQIFRHLADRQEAVGL